MTPATAGNKSRTVAQMFNMLDAWRHLPGYRLEGRLAPFFELFLQDVLGECLKDELHAVGLHPVVIPEFPLRKGTLYGENAHAKPNQSYKVDYVAFSKDRKKVFFVELKTDMNSIGGGQERYLRDARGTKIKRLVDGIIKICKATDYESKYAHLLHRLASLKLVSIYDPENLYQAALSQSRPAWCDAIGKVRPTVDEKLRCTRVIYIQPRKPNCETSKTESDQDFKHIDFEDAADIVQRFGDLGCIFANFLRQWTEDPGQQAPRTAADQQ